jgi:hypothetical protein
VCRAVRKLFRSSGREAAWEPEDVSLSERTMFQSPVARRKSVGGEFGQELDLAGSLRAGFCSGSTLEVHVEDGPRGQEDESWGLSG